MKAVTRYISDEGGEFTSKEGALLADSVGRDVDAIMAEFPITEELNWKGYYQRTPEQIQKIREGLLKIAMRVSEHHWLKQSLDDSTIHLSYAGRILSELPYKSLYRAWSRLSSIDDKGCEWNQPYFATHSEKGEQVCRNEPEPKKEAK